MIKKFIKHKGIVAPLDVSNIDTDSIIPKQFLKKITRTGFGKHLFHDWRFKDDEGKILNSDFILNKTAYKYSSILLTRENFGCGSSREHALWALTEFGFKVVIASSFADIFYSNSINNHLLPVRLNIKEIEEMFQLVSANSGINFTVDLEHQTIWTKNKVYNFIIDGFHRHRMMNGLDDISMTLQYKKLIENYEVEQPIFLQ